MGTTWEIQSHLGALGLRARQALHWPHWDEKKMSQRSAPARGLGALARTRVSHNAAQREKTVRRSALLGVALVSSAGTNEWRVPRHRCASRPRPPYRRLLPTPHRGCSTPKQDARQENSRQAGARGARALTQPQVCLWVLAVGPALSCRVLLALPRALYSVATLLTAKNHLQQLPSQKGVRVCVRGQLLTQQRRLAGAARPAPGAGGRPSKRGEAVAPRPCSQRDVHPLVSVAVSDGADRRGPRPLLCPGPSPHGPCVGPDGLTHRSHPAGCSQALSLCKGRNDSKTQLLRSQYHEPWLVWVSG